MLTKEEVVKNWGVRSMFIELQDGTDSICQENGYTLNEILQAMDAGCHVYFD